MIKEILHYEEIKRSLKSGGGSPSDRRFLNLVWGGGGILKEVSYCKTGSLYFSPGLENVIDQNNVVLQQQLGPPSAWTLR
jgi:hypothetical protein